MPDVIDNLHDILHLMAVERDKAKEHLEEADKLFSKAVIILQEREKIVEA